MTMSIRGFSCVAPLAIVVSLSWQLSVIAQSKSWNADQLSSPFPARQTEKALVEQLRSGTPAEKAVACKQLAIYGSKDAVPELSKLLSNEQLSSWSRTALEAIDDPAADAALIAAAKSVEGELLVGVINTIGVRRTSDAVDTLAGHLQDTNPEVAAAAAIALGRIGGDRAIHSLHSAYATASPSLRNAIAEGGIYAAEDLVAAGDKDKAIQIYDAIRSADVSPQRVLEATRGAILARGPQGVPLLVEQLRSNDRRKFAVALQTARELQGAEVADALAAELENATPDRAAAIVATLGDRGDSRLPAAVLRAVRDGDTSVRLAALQVVGRMGDETTVATLLEIAASEDGELSAAAKAALATLPGDKVNRELARRLPDASGKTLAVLIELVGQRRINAVAELAKALRSSDESTRSAALAALGAAAGPNDLGLLIQEVSSAKNSADAELAAKALKTACVRMPDREATAEKLAAAMPASSNGNKARLIEILGAMGGPKALDTIAGAVKSGDDELQDAGTRALGEWMTPDAAPVLLEITKTAEPGKYRVRALRGYLRIARQQKLPDAERLTMCRQALALADRDEERALVLDALKRCPTAESIELASSLLDDKAVKQHAVETAVFIAEKIKDKNPAAAKAAAEKALKADPNGKLADRARAITNQ
jgi:HEAT repeat protein